MRIGDLYKTILEEGISSVLFHHTDYWNLLGILRKNKFILSTVADSQRDAEINKGRKFYLSTSRTRTSAYRKDSFNSISGIDSFIQLDGRLLSNRFKGAAVDFYGNPNSRNIRSYEQEDRVMSDKPDIPNAISYITRIDLFSNKKHVPSEIEIDDMLRLTGGKVPIYFYKNEQDFMNGNIKKALDLRLIFENVLNEASIATRRWIAENVPENYKRPMLAVVNLINRSGVQLSITHSDNQIRTIAKLYNVDMVMLSNLVKKMQIFFM